MIVMNIISLYKVMHSTRSDSILIQNIMKHSITQGYIYENESL